MYLKYSCLELIRINNITKLYYIIVMKIYYIHITYFITIQNILIRRFLFYFLKNFIIFYFIIIKYKI